MEFVDQIVIKVALSEHELELTKDEKMRYSYRLWDGRTGFQMFSAEEDETCFNNGSRGHYREFVMPFVDAMGNEGFKLNKTRSLKADCCPMFCCCCCSVSRCWKCCGQCCADYDNDYAERGFSGFMTLT